METDRFERLLRGYRLPEVPSELDDRVLGDAAAILARARTAAAVEDAGRTLLDRLGLGFVTWLVDLVTATDAEYRVAFL